MIKLSIIIPTYNEIKLGFLKQNLIALKAIEDIEVICIDRQSLDGTSQLIKSLGYSYYSTKANGRSVRLNVGISHAQADLILLCHPRSLLDIEGIKFLVINYKILVWGGFHHCFDKDSLGLKFTSWYSNIVRAKICSNLYLDHCIFFNKEFFKKYLGDNEEIVPNVSIFEDTLLSYKLRKYHPALLVDYFVVTSAVRFEKNGFLYQAFLNQILKVLFYFGVSDEFMNRVYEKKLFLNSKY